MKPASVCARACRHKKGLGVPSFLFAFMLLLGMPQLCRAFNTGPTFTNTNHTLIMCENSPAVDITSFLSASDPDPGQTETWSVHTSPSHGILDGFTSQVSSGAGGTINPASSMHYTPVTGYSGTDTFSITIDDGSGASSTVTIVVGINELVSLVPGTIPAVNAGDTSTYIPFTGLTVIGPHSSSIGFTGGMQYWLVPAGVNTLTFDLAGASGGSDSYSGAPNPGLGGRVQGQMFVGSNEMLALFVGGVGQALSGNTALGGFNGGGNAIYYPPFTGAGGAGGGATDIRRSSTGLANRIVVAGGGGGNGADQAGPLAGGKGGDTIGGNSANNNGGGHSGGGQLTHGGLPATYSGWTSGSAGTSGTGGVGSISGISGGGGGGYYGGGGGVWTGGGGGASFAGAMVTSSVVYTQGFNTGNGQMAFTYSIPGTYTITWDSVAHAAGLADTTDTLLTSPINLRVPATLAGGSYHGILTASTHNCDTGYPVVLTSNAPVSTAISALSGQQTGISIYPNPATESINVELSAATGGNVTVVMLNTLGEPVITQKTGSRKETLNIANLPAGCYLVNCFQDGAKIAAARFIKE